MSYPHWRKFYDPPADITVHGDLRCASTERFRCRACRLDVCWCKGHSGSTRLDGALCDDCSVLLTEAEWARVFAFESANTRWPWMSHTTALRLIRSRTADARAATLMRFT